MFSRIVMSLLCFGVLSFAILIPAALSQAKGKSEPETPTPQIDMQVTKDLVKAASIILIAEVQVVQSPSKTPNTAQSSDSKIDLQKELDRTREETSRTYTGLTVGSLVRLNTVETLKGPKTQILSIPITDSDLQKAAPGNLYLIMMGPNHPDAIRPLFSIKDPWVEQVKAALAN